MIVQHDKGTDPDNAVILHATAVSLGGRAVVLIGPSGSGKSSVALQLLALGAQLVADDRLRITVQGDDLTAHAPEYLAGHIEARGIGILRADYVAQAKIALIVDFEHVEKDRLPPPRSFPILGIEIPLLRSVEAPFFPAAIIQFLKDGRADI